jgi:dGTPase
MARAKVQKPAKEVENRPPGRLLEVKFTLPAHRAAYATTPEVSRGRFFSEPESRTRTCYQRDRDRIIHSTAFRRLKHKTQVFIHEEGDYYRTRMTHSLEVAQIARSLARVLALDEDLAETLALAHDLGHTPFGHAGEEALSEASASIGGFDHNAHALRLVTKLEHRYAQFDGLNLTWETLEGLVKHNGPLAPPLSLPIASFDARWPLDLSSWSSLEAQLASLADDIAYVNHDIDDGLRAGLFAPEDLQGVPLASAPVSALLATHRDRLELGRFIGELVRTLIGALVDDLLAETQKQLEARKPRTAGEIRTRGAATAAFSTETASGLAGLKSFLFARMYRHPRVANSVEKAKAVVCALFSAFARDPTLLPDDWTRDCGDPNDAATQGVVRDYIAGMTDRFALSEYRRVFDTEIAL